MQGRMGPEEWTRTHAGNTWTG